MSKVRIKIVSKATRLHASLQRRTGKKSINKRGLQQGTHPYLQIPDLPSNNRKQDECLENRPPFDTRVGGLGSVSMWPFPDQHILLLILHCGQTRCQFSDFSFDWSNHVWKTRMFRTRSYTTMGLHTVTGNIDDAMHVETTGNHEWNSRAMTSWMRSYLTTLSEIALIWFEKQYSCRPSFSAVIETWPVDSLICFPSTIPVGSCNY